jgi:DNA-binding MarR family transcriptional regulator
MQVTSEQDVPGPVAPERIAALRAFDRFYTDVVGALRSGLLGTSHNLTEARVLYELAQGDSSAVSELRRRLDIDPGYLSRILRGFAADGLVTLTVAPHDARQRAAGLTDRGREVFADLDRRSDERADRFLRRIGETDQQRLLAAMATVRDVLDGRSRVDLAALPR